MITYSREAEQDVEKLHDWLLQFGPRSAELFMAHLALAERRIADHPLMYRRWMMAKRIASIQDKPHDLSG